MSVNKTEQYWEMILKYFNNYWKVPVGFGKITGVSLTIIKHDEKLSKLETFKIVKQGNGLITKWNNEHEYPILKLLRTLRQLKIEDPVLDVLITYNRDSDTMILTVMNDNTDYDVFEVEYIMEMEDLQNVTVHENVRVWDNIKMQDYYRERISDYSYSFMDDEGTLISYAEYDHKKPKSPFWKE